MRIDLRVIGVVRSESQRAQRVDLCGTLRNELSLGCVSAGIGRSLVPCAIRHSMRLESSCHASQVFGKRMLASVAAFSASNSSPSSSAAVAVVSGAFVPSASLQKVDVTCSFGNRAVENQDAENLTTSSSPPRLGMYHDVEEHLSARVLPLAGSAHPRPACCKATHPRPSRRGRDGPGDTQGDQNETRPEKKAGGYEDTVHLQTVPVIGVHVTTEAVTLHGMALRAVNHRHYRPDYFRRHPATALQSGVASTHRHRAR